MREKESAPKKFRFFSCLRGWVSGVFKQKSETHERKKEPEPTGDTAETQGDAVETPRKASPEEPREEKQRAEERYARRRAKRAKRREDAKRANAEQSRQNTGKSGVRQLEGGDEYLSDEQIEAALQEKMTDEEDKPMRTSDILQGYPAKPQVKLDLHRFTAEEAKMEIQSFIHTSSGNGLKTVIIITGKGTHSKAGQSILRDVAEEKIVELKRQGLVFHFKWERIRKSRSGAIIVYLK